MADSCREMQAKRWQSGSMTAKMDDVQGGGRLIYESTCARAYTVHECFVK